MNLNEIMNRPLGIDELSPNDLAILSGKGGNGIVKKILKRLDDIAKAYGDDGTQITQHKWYVALRKTDQFFAHWNELQSSYNFVQTDLMNFSTYWSVPYFKWSIPSPWKSNVDIFYNWLVRFDIDLLQWANENFVS